MLGKGSLKAEPNYYFSSLALNIFKGFAQYLHLSFFFSLYYYEIMKNFSWYHFSIIKDGDGIFSKTVPLLLSE